MGMGNGRRKRHEEDPPRVRLYPSDDDAAKLYPHLVEHLFPLVDADGKLQSEAGSITVKVDGSYYRVTITVPRWKATTGFSTATLVDILGQIEHHLESTTDWATSWAEKRKQKSRWT